MYTATEKFLYIPAAVPDDSEQCGSIDFGSCGCRSFGSESATNGLTIKNGS